jgi:hypothetical protein
VEIGGKAPGDVSLGRYHIEAVACPRIYVEFGGDACLDETPGIGYVFV